MKTIPNLNLTDPEATRMLFGALLTYIQGRPVIIFGTDGLILHGEENAKNIAALKGIADDMNILCCCVYGIDPQEFFASDWAEIMEAARRNWMQGETFGQSFINFVKANMQ